MARTVTRRCVRPSQAPSGGASVPAASRPARPAQAARRRSREAGTRFSAWNDIESPGVLRCLGFLMQLAARTTIPEINHEANHKPDHEPDPGFDRETRP